MADNWEWDSSDGEHEGTPQFRQFKKEERAPAGEKGLWAILDSVARQPARSELRYESREDSLNIPPPPIAPAPPPASFAGGFLDSLARPSAPAPPPVAPLQKPQSFWSPPPVSPPPPPPAAQPSPGFGHLFRRQRDEPVAAPQGGTSLKALFKRIS